MAHPRTLEYAKADLWVQSRMRLRKQQTPLGARSVFECFFEPAYCLRRALSPKSMLFFRTSFSALEG